MFIDADQLAADVEDTIEAFGSTVHLPLGVSLRCVKVTNEREMAKLLKIEGDRLDKVASVFLFDATSDGKVTKGTRIVNQDDAFIVEVIHTEKVDDTVVYIAAGSFSAS